MEAWACGIGESALLFEPYRSLIYQPLYNSPVRSLDYGSFDGACQRTNMNRGTVGLGPELVGFHGA